MGGLHVLAPDLGRQPAAGDALHRAVVVIAEPDRGDEPCRVADEPGVAEILRGAGLAADLPAGDVGLGAGAADHHLMQHGVHHRQRLRLDDRAEARRRAGIDHLAGGRLHLPDDIGQHALAAIGEGRIGRRQLDRRHLRGAERQREVRLQSGVDAEALGGADDLLGRHFIDQPRRDRVQRMRQRGLEGDRAAIGPGVVLRLPALERDRAVVADRVGRQAFLQRSEIDEGLEGRARLALRRRGAVELALGVVAPADQRTDAAIGRHRDDAPWLTPCLAPCAASASTRMVSAEDCSLVSIVVSTVTSPSTAPMKSSSTSIT